MASKTTKTSVHSIDEKHTEIMNEINHNEQVIIPQLMEEKRMHSLKKPIELPKAHTIKPITKVNSATSLVASMGILKK